MFDEAEPGKPRNWGVTIGIISVISLMNICIFVVIRVMLDSENEFDEPIIQGELRNDLTKFLGIFSLTFCFGCWCCFCCAGNCCRCTLCCSKDNCKLTGTEDQKAKARVGTLRRKEANVEFDVESNEMDDAVSYHHKDREHLQPKPQSPALPKTLERQVSADIPDHSVTHFSSASSSSGEIQFARPISFHTTASKIACKSVCNDEEGPHILKYAPPRVRKSSEEYGRLNSSYNESKPSMHTDRRMSLQVQQNEEVAKRKMSPQVLQNPGALAIQKKSAKRGNTAVRGVDFFQIPVQMLTPSTVGIINKGFDESPSSPKDFTEVNIDK